MTLQPVRFASQMEGPTDPCTVTLGEITASLLASPHLQPLTAREKALVLLDAATRAQCVLARVVKNYAAGLT